MALKSSALLRESFDTLERGYFEAWRSTEDTHAREALWFTARACTEIRDHLYAICDALIAASREASTEERTSVDA